MFNNRFNISLPLAASLTAIGVAALVTIVYLWGVLGAILGPGTGSENPDAVLTRYMERHQEEMDEYTDRFTGRSLFYIPPVQYTPPPVTTRKPVEPQTEPDPEPEPEPEPVQTKGPYTGPSVIFAVGSEVWFQPPGPNDPQLRLRIGETAHGVTLKDVNLPGQVTVDWNGYDYTLDLLGRNFPSDWSNGSQRITKSRPEGESPTPGLVIVPKDGPMPERMYQPDDRSPQENPEQDVATTADIEMPRQRPRPMPAQLNTPDELDVSPRRETDIDNPLRDPYAGDETNSAASDSPDDDDVTQFEGPPVPPHIRRMMDQQQSTAEADAARVNEDDAAQAESARKTTDRFDTERESETPADDPQSEPQSDDPEAEEAPAPPQSQAVAPS